MPIDPQAQFVLDLIKNSGRPPYEALTPEEARAAQRAARPVLQPDAPDVGALRDLTAEGPGGPIKLRLYRGAGAPAGAVPGLVYFHGGGWVIGDIESHDVVCRQIANAADAVVVSVDYRLGPEHKFPAAVEDAIAATDWVAGAAERLGIDPARLAVGGDSAGGNLAIVTAIAARDRAEPAPNRPPIALQALVYPATEFAMRHDSHRRFGEGYFLTRSLMEYFRDHYLRNPADIDDWRASPLRVADLTRLPPALVLTAGFDPLCDEGEEYARNLAAAGVRVTMRRFPGQIHGFFSMGRIINAANEAVAEVAAALRGLPAA